MQAERERDQLRRFLSGATGPFFSMDPNWNDNQPIYRQLRDRVVAMILEGVLKEGDALPSVRQVAAEYRLNPLTVLKGYQELVDEDLVEKRRGRGMFVLEGARQALLKPLRILDQQLGQTEFIAGDRFTMGDIPVGMRVHRWHLFDLETPPMANLRRWYDALRARPAFVEHIADPMLHLAG